MGSRCTKEVFEINEDFQFRDMLSYKHIQQKWVVPPHKTIAGKLVHWESEDHHLLDNEKIAREQSTEVTTERVIMVSCTVHDEDGWGMIEEIWRYLGRSEDNAISKKYYIDGEGKSCSLVGKEVGFCFLFFNLFCSCIFSGFRCESFLFPLIDNFKCFVFWILWAWWLAKCIRYWNCEVICVEKWEMRRS